MAKIIKITESDLHRTIKNTVSKILSEGMDELSPEFLLHAAERAKADKKNYPGRKSARDLEMKAKRDRQSNLFSAGAVDQMNKELGDEDFHVSRDHGNRTTMKYAKDSKSAFLRPDSDFDTTRLYDDDWQEGDEPLTMANLEPDEYERAKGMFDKFKGFHDRASALEESIGSDIKARFRGAKTGSQLGKSGINKNRSFVQKNIDPYTNKLTNNYLNKGTDPGNGEWNKPKDAFNGVNLNFFRIAGIAGADQESINTLLKGLSGIGYKQNSIGKYQAEYNEGLKINQQSQGNANIQEANGFFDKMKGAVKGFMNPYRMNQDLMHVNYARGEAENFKTARNTVQGSRVQTYFAAIRDITNTIIDNINVVQSQMGNFFTVDKVCEMANGLKIIFMDASEKYDKQDTNHDNIENVTATLNESQLRKIVAESVKKNVIKLNESTLRNIVAESVKKVLREWEDDPDTGVDDFWAEMDPEVARRSKYRKDDPETIKKAQEVYDKLMSECPNGYNDWEFEITEEGIDGPYTFEGFFYTDYDDENGGTWHFEVGCSGYQDAENSEVEDTSYVEFTSPDGQNGIVPER